ncbi:4936_t:CDS:10 [Entrophospora sp. SA101]|nr:11334_t:CDS:10 [Entrophospora sp. SA101]CAJ0761438.1 8600_t:CDS:10 [Entrophospora sp. SA101]CAJ0766133.1 4936_t:CDS:10 [Entrophospora sp. SA101]
MSSPRVSGSTGRDSPALSATDPFQFDENKFSSNAANPEKQELYLFNWLSNLERELKRTDKDTIKSHQVNLEKLLLKIISLVSPKPRRPIRNLVARCFVIIYVKGDSRSLFDTVTALQSILGVVSKGTGEKETKLAALHCIGVILKSLGDRILSLFPETINICLKTIKNTNNPLIIRLEATYTITRSFEGASKAATEGLIKDIMKQLKASLNDKALIIRVAAIECMHTMAKLTNQKYPITKSELDQIIAQMVKILDGSNQTIRRSVASYLATLLAQTQCDADYLSTSTSPPSKNNSSSQQSQTSSGSPTSNSIQDIAADSPKLSVEEMLSILSSIYKKSSTTREMRAAIIETYSSLFINLGTKYVQVHYATIAQHLLNDLVSNVKSSPSRYDVLNVREHCGLLLRDVIGTRLLSEQGQLTAVRELANGWIKKWPALMPTETEPSKWALVCAANEISGLLIDLGGAANTILDVIMNPLVLLLSHPSHSVQVATAWCLRCLCFSLPIKLTDLITKTLNLLNKDLNNLGNHTSPDLPKKTLGHAYGLAALLSVVHSRLLDVSFELSARVFSLATQLIKSSSNKDLAVASVQIQVAWILVGSLMSLGPNFVKLHLPQLLLLWKTALPKPSSKDSVSNRTEGEWTFMFHVRECVVGAMLSFLSHNSKLITADVAKRLAALLSNALSFISLVPTTFSNSSTTPNSSTTSIIPPLPSSTSLKFIDRDNMLKRRIIQCFILIKPVSSFENLSSQLLKICLSNFADPEKNMGSAITAAIAAVSGSYTSVWTTGNEYGFGVTSRLQGINIDIANHFDNNQNENKGNVTRDWINRDLVESKVENQLPKPVPSATALIDYSIELFGLIFPFQSSTVQESYLDQLMKAVRHVKLEKSPGRKMAVQVNMVLALLCIFKNIINFGSNKKSTSDINVPSIAEKKVGSLAMELLQEAIVHPDPYLRNAASDALGKLLSIAGGNLIPTQMQLLVDQVVSNRDPDTRAGSALALGSIYSNVGSMAAGSHLKTLVGILLSLSSDPHPVVHFWALYSLSKTIESAGLMFSPYVSSTLGIIAKLYMSETHEPGGGTVGTTNVGLGLSAYQQFGRIIYGLIGTLGPELQTSTKVRDLCLNLMVELRNDEDQMVVVESIRCLQHFIMFAQQYVDLPKLVALLQYQLSSMHLPLKEVAITCLYQLVQKNAKLVFDVASPGLDNQLFSLLDTDPTIDGVKDIVKSWLNQTANDSPSTWVELCRKVMSKTGSIASAGAPIEPPSLDISGGGDDDDELGGGVDDEEVESFGAEQSDSIAKKTSIKNSSTKNHSLEKNIKFLNDSSVQIPPRWRTQLFAMKCLHQVVEVIYASGDKSHFDLISAKKVKNNGNNDFLVLKVAELIKMAFIASTAVVSEMRLEGLRLLRDLIEKFAATQDPEFEEAALLEQYQAQIGAALTPAFTAESSPEILSAAVKVCAVFVGSGIVKELYRMGRILKLLTTALENCKDNSGVTTVGDIGDLSPHAAIMVKLSVLNAWAELQVSSVKQSYLVQVVEPNLSLLSQLWVTSLKEYARVQIEPDIAEAQANSIGSDLLQNTTQTEVFDSMYSGLTREVILPVIIQYYNRSWLTILGAVASLALSQTFGGGSTINSDNDNDLNKNEDKKVVKTCINALKAFLRPISAGTKFLDKQNFVELMNLFDRLVLTEGFQTQFDIIQIIKNIVKDYGATYICSELSEKSSPKLNGHTEEDIDDDKLSADDVEDKSKTILYQILRVLVNIFFQKISLLSSRPITMRTFRPLQGNSKGQTLQQTTTVLKASLEIFTLLVPIVPINYKIDLVAIAFYVYMSIIQDLKFQNDLVPNVLVNLKMSCASLEDQFTEKQDFENYSKVLQSTISSAISRILLNSEATSDENEVSIIKNCLLAIVLIFTSCPNACLNNNEIQYKFLEILKNKYKSENTIIAITSLQCTRTLILLSTKTFNKESTTKASVELSNRFTKVLIPEVVLFLESSRDLIEDINDSKVVEEKLKVVEEAIKTLLTMNNVTNESHKSIILAIILPTLIHLLADPPLDCYLSTTTTPQQKSLPPLHILSMTNILSLATSQSTYFKDAVNLLSPEPKSKLEAAIRFNVLLQQEQRKLHEEREKKINDEVGLSKDMATMNYTTK